MIVGILALQGNFIQHKILVDQIGVQNMLIRYPNEIDKCDLLIMPGGESTTISKQIDNNEFREKLIEFAIEKPILGTCAGMIMLSTSMPNKNMLPLNIMDFHIERNAWGRQVDSFSANINLHFDATDMISGEYLADINILPPECQKCDYLTRCMGGCSSPYARVAKSGGQVDYLAKFNGVS